VEQLFGVFAVAHLLKGVNMAAFLEVWEVWEL
jgi:hypothetical protein